MSPNTPSRLYARARFDIGALVAILHSLLGTAKLDEPYTMSSGLHQAASPLARDLIGKIRAYTTIHRLNLILNLRELQAVARVNTILPQAR